MQENQTILHFSHRSPGIFGSENGAPVPAYSLYGDPPASLDEWVNLEPLEKRCRERGWDIAPHTHPRFAQIVLVTHGHGEFIVESESQRYTAPCAKLIPAFHIHGFRYSQDSLGHVLTIQTPYLNGLILRTPDLGSLLGGCRLMRLDAATLERAKTHIDEIGRELAGDAIGRTVALEIHLLGLLLALLRFHSAEMPGAGAPASTTGAMDGVQRYIEAHFREQPGMSEIAKAMGMTASRLRSLCKAEAGLSPMDILHDRIMFEAKRLLIYSNRNISDIGYSLGFGDPAYFNRFFVRLAGETPTEFRRARSEPHQMTAKKVKVRPRESNHQAGNG